MVSLCTDVAICKQAEQQSPHKVPGILADNTLRTRDKDRERETHRERDTEGKRGSESWLSSHQIAVHAVYALSQAVFLLVVISGKNTQTTVARPDKTNLAG